LKFLGFQEFPNKLLYILEFPDRFLSDYAENEGIPEEFLWNLINSVLSALEFLEKNVENPPGNILLSFDNIVICKDMAIKLCDISESVKIVKNIRIEQGFISDENHGFSPPEDFLLNINKKPDIKTTIFSLGILICKLVDYQAFNEFVEKRMICDTQGNFNEFLVKIKRKISVELWEIVMFMTNYDKELRLNVGDLMIFGKKNHENGKKEVNCDDFEKIVKKKEKDIFFLKDQLRVANEQNQRLSKENEKIRNKNGGNLKENPMFFSTFFNFFKGFFF